LSPVLQELTLNPFRGTYADVQTWLRRSASDFSVGVRRQRVTDCTNSRAVESCSHAAHTDTDAKSCSTMSTFHVTGVATDDDGAPVIGATVTVSPDWHIPQPPYSSVSAVTDGRGSYSIDFEATHTAPNVEFAHVNAQSPGHEPFFDYLFPASDSQKSQNVSMNLHLYRIKRIIPGESTVVTVVPGDTTCGWSDELTCRTVRVVVPTDGLLTVSCPGLTLPGNAVGSPWHVTAGTQPAVDVGMWFQSTVSQSCVFNTSLVRP
jgi:hypothetical protein